MAVAVTAETILRGRREGALLALPSVQRMADVLAARCREQSWVRTSVASLERFRALAGYDDLEAFLARARAEPAEAERALGSFAAALGPAGRTRHLLDLPGPAGAARRCGAPGRGGTANRPRRPARRVRWGLGVPRVRHRSCAPPQRVVDSRRQRGQRRAVPGHRQLF